MADEPNEPTAARNLRCSAELLWGGGERPTRGPKPGLSLTAIVDAAIKVADADGIEALSMRRIASELGAGKMSLYRYVPGKAVLLDLMLDRVSDPVDYAVQTEGMRWRDALEVHARSSYHMYLAHPWLIQINWSRPVFGPNTLAGLELLISRLDGLGLADQERVHVMIMVDSYITGSVRSQLLYDRAAEESGVSDEDFWAMQYPVLERAMATGNYPTMAGLAEDSFSGSWEDSFEFGLQRLLDGLEALVNRRGPG